MDTMMLPLIFDRMRAWKQIHATKLSCRIFIKTTAWNALISLHKKHHTTSFLFPSQQFATVEGNTIKGSRNETFEWTSMKQSELLCALCEMRIPESFWCKTNVKFTTSRVACGFRQGKVQMQWCRLLSQCEAHILHFILLQKSMFQFKSRD